MVGDVNDKGDRELLRQLAGAILMDYNAVEGRAPSYLVAVHQSGGRSETDEESG